MSLTSSLRMYKSIQSNRDECPSVQLSSFPAPFARGPHLFPGIDEGGDNDHDHEKPDKNVSGIHFDVAVEA